MSRCQGVKVSRCQGVKVSRSQGVKVSTSQGLKVSRSQGLKVSRSQGQAQGGPGVGAYRDVPADQVSFIGHGALADKRRQWKSPYKSGDFPESNTNDDSLILQTCLSRRVSGDSKTQQV